MRNELQELKMIADFSDNSVKSGLENLNKFIESSDKELCRKYTGPLDSYNAVSKLLQNFGPGTAILGTFCYKGVYSRIKAARISIKSLKEK